MTREKDRDIKRLPRPLYEWGLADVRKVVSADFAESLLEASGLRASGTL